MPRFWLLLAVLILGPVVRWEAASGQVVLNVPSPPYPTIQSAIAAALPGSLVRVAAGNYAEFIDFLGKAITVESLSGGVTISGTGGPGVVVRADSFETANTVLRGVAVVNSPTGAPAIAVECIGSSPRFENCTLASSPLSPGGTDALVVSITGGAPVFADCQFTASAPMFSTARCVMLAGGTVTFTGCSFFGTVLFSGPVRLITASSAGLTVINGTFSEYDAFSFTALSATSSTLICRGSLFTGSGSIDGTGISHSGPQATISDCTFSQIGGDTYSVISTSGPALIERCTITQCGPAFGGTCISAGPGTTVVETRIVGNANGLGVSGPATLRSCLIARNTSGGVQSGTGLATIENCTIADNADPFGGGWMGGVTGNAALTNCIVWGNAPVQVGPSVIAFVSDIQGGAPGFGVFSFDPLFVNPQAGDYHLGAGSPCIDRAATGVPLTAKDIDGQPRVLYFAPDLGADEFLPPSGVTLSISQSGSMVTIQNQGGTALAPYFTALTLDPANSGAGAGAGFWGGLHASLHDLAVQFATGAVPFVGNLGAAGGSSLTFPLPSGLGGLTAYGISHVFHPATFAFTAVSPVVSHTIP